MNRTAVIFGLSLLLAPATARARPLLLTAGVPVQVVAQRLGHAQVSQTLEVYAHATPGLQADAAARLDALLSEGTRLPLM